MITCYLKLSNYCSLGCSHCYIPEEKRANPNAIMTESVLLASLEQVYQLCKSSNDKELCIVWHGGEPLQLPLPLVTRRLIAINHYFMDRGINCIHSMQSSLIPLNKEWVEVIHRFFNSQVGISFDPSSRNLLGDYNRYDQVLQKRIKYAQASGLKLFANICPTQSDIGKEKNILDWLDENNICTFSIDRFNNFGKDTSTQCPTNKQHSNFLINLLEESIRRVKLSKRVSVCTTLISGINGVLNGNQGDRWGTSCLKNFIVIDPDGRTNSCPDKISYEDSYSDSDDFYRSYPRLQAITEHTTSHSNNYCGTCEYVTWCKTGCPITPNDPKNQGDCSGYKTFLNKIRALSESDDVIFLKNYLGEKNEEN